MSSKPPATPVSEEPASDDQPVTSDLLNHPELVRPTFGSNKLRTTVVLLLVVVLLAGASFGTYRLYLDHQSKTANASTSAQTGTVDPYEGWKTYTSPTEQATFKYPSNWTITTPVMVSNDSKNTDQVGIKSPSGAITISYVTDLSGFGNESGASYPLNIVVAKTAIPKAPGLYVVSGTTTLDGTTYHPWIAVQDSNGILTSGVMGDVVLFTSYHAVNPTTNDFTGILFSTSAARTNQNSPALTKAQADAWFAGSEAKQARLILLSLVDTPNEYLTIKEWGVKLPLSDAIRDAYYFPDASSVDKNGAPDAMWLASKSLTSATCDPLEPTLAGKGVIGRFMRALPTDVDHVTGQLMTQEYTNGVTIAGYYYFYDSWARELTCVPVPTTQPIDATFSGAAEGVVSIDSSSTNSYSGWKTYFSAVDHIVISYPSNWTLNTKNAPYQEVGYDSATITSPSGTVLNVYANTGGKGGACQPASQDVPFAKGNNCSTLEYLSSEDLHLGGLFNEVEVANTNPVHFDTRPASAYLVTTHYADNDGVQSYGIGLGEPVSGDNFPLNTPLMGGYPPYSWLTVYNSQGQSLPYIYVYANSSSPSFLTSGDAATVKNIIRSFRLNV